MLFWFAYAHVLSSNAMVNTGRAFNTTPNAPAAPSSIPSRAADTFAALTKLIVV